VQTQKFLKKGKRMNRFIFLLISFSFLFLSAVDNPMQTTTNKNFYPLFQSSFPHERLHQKFAASAVLFLIGEMLVLDPIKTLLGATFLLSYFDHFMTETSLENFNTPFSFQHYLPERDYYEKRYHELTDLRYEFFLIIVALRTISSQSLLLQILKENLTEWRTIVNPTRAVVARFNQRHKENLRETRQMELSLLEYEINHLQSMIAFHFNELIIQSNATFEELYKIQSRFKKMCHAWQQSHAISDRCALKSYEVLLLEIHLINQSFAFYYDLSHAIAFYENEVKATVIKKTTNIIELLAHIKPQLKYIHQFITQSKESNRMYIKSVENYLTSRGFNSTELYNKIQNTIKQTYSIKQIQKHLLLKKRQEKMNTKT
jgi:hypothetical protein